jgi:hypothetical protein
MRSSILALVLLVVVACPARAGTYEHHTLSPASPGLDGWSPYAYAPGGFAATAAGADGLSAQFWARPSFAPGDVAEWVYTAPADTTISAWDFERAVSGIEGGDWNTLFGASADGRVRWVAHDVPSVNRQAGWVRADGLGATSVWAILLCGGPHPCRAAGTAALLVRNVRVVLHDGFAPVAAGVQGDLATPGALSGTAGLSFSATDRGAGLYRAYAVVDGRRQPPVAIGDGRCRDILAGGSEYQFAFRRPCSLVGSAVVALDTSTIPDGRHTVAVAVEDAAGNATTLYGPATRAIDNVPDPPLHAPRPAAPPIRVTAWFERRGHRATTVTVPYGERVRIRGRVTTAPPVARVAAGAAGRFVAVGDRRAAANRLVAADRPVAGAALEIAERVLIAGARWRRLTGVPTRADGRFTGFTRVGPSRRLRIAAPGGAVAVLTLRVRAAVTARLADGVLRGRVGGGRIPRGGARVELQARAGSRWVTRRVVRTLASGRYSGRPGTRGAVRARVPRQPGLPYAAGVSPPRRAGRTAAGTSR